jgi:hypothetical protein
MDNSSKLPLLVIDKLKKPQTLKEKAIIAQLQELKACERPSDRSSVHGMT